MTEEEKATLEAPEVETEVQTEVDTKDEQPTDGEPQGEPKEDSEQLKAELERERTARLKAEKAASDLAFKNRDKKRKEEPQEDLEVDKDKPLTARDIQALLAKEREAIRKETQLEKIGQLASQMSSSETEKELILEIHKNRSFPAHLSVEEQLEECYILANKKKILGENSELKRALSSKSRVSTDSSTTHHDAPTASQPKLPADEAAEYARVGFKWNATNRTYEKKLPDGTKLVKNPRTGETRQVSA